MKRKDLLRALRKYRQNKATAEERSLIDQLYESMDRPDSPSASAEEEKELEKKYWAAISAAIRKSNATRGRSRALVTWSSVGIAASLLAGVALYFFEGDRTFYGESLAVQPLAHAAEEGKILTNDAKDAKLFVLEDGTHVTLEPASRLNVSAEFGVSARAVHLEGEAYFEVARDTLRPFLVHASEVTARVLGTCFRVKAFREDKDVMVAVSEGKVKVYTDSNRRDDSETDRNLILTPNQKIVYDRETEKILRGIIDNPKVVLPAQEIKRMRFEERPVPEILKALSRLYGVEITFDEKALSTCFLTTSITEGDLYGRLDVICNAINATYSLNENTIEVRGEGCSTE
jgi:ferric-dicitrate binding protein FerR (iron transport regulator)